MKTITPSPNKHQWPIPCIIRFSPLFDCYEVFNEAARLVCRRSQWPDAVCVSLQIGYAQVPINSRLGRTIMDRINNKTTQLE